MADDEGDKSTALEDTVADEPVRNFTPSFDLEGIPMCVRWSKEDVAEWIAFLGFPQYKVRDTFKDKGTFCIHNLVKECFTENEISGRRLILVDASLLPKIGITDFKHILFISKKCRELLGIEDPYWNRSIALPPRETLAHFLERKSHSGKRSDRLRIDDHRRYMKEFNQHGVPPKSNVT